MHEGAGGVLQYPHAGAVVPLDELSPTELLVVEVSDTLADDSFSVDEDSRLVEALEAVVADDELPSSLSVVLSPLTEELLEVSLAPVDVLPELPVGPVVADEPGALECDRDELLAPDGEPPLLEPPGALDAFVPVVDCAGAEVRLDPGPPVLAPDVEPPPLVARLPVVPEPPLVAPASSSSALAPPLLEHAASAVIDQTRGMPTTAKRRSPWRMPAE